MGKYRKKPVVIEARQVTRGNMADISMWCGGSSISVDPDNQDGDHFLIGTLEGSMKSRIGDWVIKGVNGEFYPCKPDIFEKTYEAVDE